MSGVLGLVLGNQPPERVAAIEADAAAFLDMLDAPVTDDRRQL